LVLTDSNGHQLKRWEMNSKGIKFFRTQDQAEKFFLYMTHKLFKQTSDLEHEYKRLYQLNLKISPDFIKHIK
jgi:hypothetical protein